MTRCETCGTTARKRRDRRRLWTSFQMKRLVKDTQEALKEAAAEYDEALGYVREQKDRHHPTDEEREQAKEIRRVRRVTDPTGDIVAEQESNRTRLEMAAIELDEAAAKVSDARLRMRRIFMDAEDEYQRLEA